MLVTRYVTNIEQFQIVILVSSMNGVNIKQVGWEDALLLRMCDRKVVSVFVKCELPWVSIIQEEVTIGQSLNIRSSFDATLTYTSQPLEFKRESERS